MNIDIVVPFHNEQDVILSFLQKLHEEIRDTEFNFCVILVNDGSNDSSEKIIRNYNNLHIKLINFSRNFGKEKAIFAGLTHSTAEFVIIMDADLQHPPELIPKLIKTIISKRVEMVYTVNNNRSDETLFFRINKSAYYKIMSHISDVPLVPNAGDFRILSRKLVDIITQYDGNNFYMKSLYQWPGFSSHGFNYQPAKRQIGKSRFNFIKLMKLAMNGLTSNSYFPLYISFTICFVLSGMTTLYSLYIFLAKIFGFIDTNWIASIIILNSTLFSILFLVIGFIGIYISKILENLDGHPRYIISETIEIAPENDNS